LKARRSRARQPADTYLPDAFVIDCSVCLAWYIGDESSAFCDRLGLAVHRSEVWVPSLWRAELVGAVVNAERRKRLTAEQRHAIIANADGLPLRVDHDVPSVVDLDALAANYDLTPYEAIYFELARRRKLALATLDAALVKAARKARLPLITDLSVFPEI
jgi:predicted nucleic acid-binding protein